MNEMDRNIFLKQLLKSNDRVFLMDDSMEMAIKMVNYMEKRNSSAACCMIGKRKFEDEKDIYSTISSEEYDRIRALYNTYEFSDVLCLLEAESIYGSMLHYVNTGILTENEYFEGLLHKRNEQE